jgi:hypothetical protein
MWHYSDARAAVRDALRLSQAMTFKSAVAGLPLGGGKGVIMAPDPSAAATHRRRSLRADALRDFGDTVEALGGSYITAEDVGTSARDMQLIASVTRHVTGLSRRHGGSGDPSPWTALGVETAIRVCCERVFGSPSLDGRTIAISGLGNVGGRVAAACSTTRASRGSARRSSRAPPTTSSPTTRSRSCWRGAACCGRRTSWSTPAGSSTSRSSSSPRATTRAAPARSCAGSATRCSGSSTTRPLPT